MARDLEVVVEIGRDAPAADLGPLSREQFDQVRNSLVRSCAAFGSVGPRGQMPIKGDEVVTAEDPDFYIVDDKYSDECRLIL